MYYPHLHRMFRLELLVTLLNSTAVPEGNAVGVMDTVQLVQQVAANELRVQDFDIRVNDVSRFGKILLFRSHQGVG